jgi:hypothetical protein
MVNKLVVYVRPHLHALREHALVIRHDNQPLGFPFRRYERGHGSSRVGCIVERLGECEDGGTGSGGDCSSGGAGGLSQEEGRHEEGSL